MKRARRGYFGEFGGMYVPETLMHALNELDSTYRDIGRSKKFKRELTSLYKEYVGRPTPLYFAKRLTQRFGGAKIYLKREDLCHTGAHKINNTVGQALLARKMGKSRLIAETGAGQHGVATATVAALMGMKCDVFMGTEDVKRQRLNVIRMKLLGANVCPVDKGSRTLKDAMNEAIRDWVTNVDDTHYVIGTVAGPHPYPVMVRDFQSVIGRETRKEILSREGKMPKAIVACIGGGSNAIGIFHPFYKDKGVKLIGVEAAGLGLDSGKHAASLCKGRVGVLHGTKSYLLQDKFGQINIAHSVSAGLDYPGVGPEHASYMKSGRAEYVAVTDRQALEGFRYLCETEGIIPALESSHALYHACRAAKEYRKTDIIIVCLSGRGDKDIDIVEKYLGGRDE